MCLREEAMVVIDLEEMEKTNEDGDLFFRSGLKSDALIPLIHNGDQR